MSNILIICGSPRKGNMYTFCDLLQGKLISREDNSNLLYLSSLNINYCDGCLLCEDEGICPIDDDLETIKNSMLAADTIIFAVPVYFDNVPGKVKSLIDRSNLFMNELKGKKCLAALCGQADIQSWNNCADIIKNYAEICGMDFGGSVAAQARIPGDIMPEKLNDMVAELIELLK